MRRHPHGRACARVKHASRWAMLAPLAATITVLLALAMQALIAVDAEPPMARGAPPALDITPTIIDTPPEPRPTPTKPQDEPAPTPIEFEVVTGGEAPDGPPAPTPPKPTNDLGAGLAASTPILAVQPSPVVRLDQRYPAAALRANLEGRCVVTFDILADGGVTNVQVAQCSHRAFEREAARAVAGYRYTPSLSGEGVVFRGARIELGWTLPD